LLHPIREPGLGDIDLDTPCRRWTRRCCCCAC